LSLTKFERETTVRTMVAFKSGSTPVDPSGNIAYVEIYKPDGTILIEGSGSKDSTGNYRYYFSTGPTDLLGIYLIDWWGRFYYGTKYDYKEKHEREVIWLVNVDQT